MRLALPKCSSLCALASIGLVAALAPSTARGARLRLLDEELVAPGVNEAGAPALQASVSPVPDLSPSLAAAAASETLDFDLLGTPATASTAIDGGSLRLRRTMLNAHQALGFGVIALELSTTMLGQLNYSDRFGGPSTGKYRTPHAISAYATLGIFATDGLLALLAPKGAVEREGVDRVTFHKYAMFTAKAGMLAQGILGVVTHDREGYVNQKGVATAHLVIGYVTLAAVAAGVSALVF